MTRHTPADEFRQPSTTAIGRRFRPHIGPSDLQFVPSCVRIGEVPSTIRDSARALMELGTGRRCVACGRVGVAWCDPCLRDAVDVHERVTPGGRLVIAGSRYDGPVRRAVISHKEHGQLGLVRPLARILATSLRPYAPALLVPAPSQPRSVRARGHDHARRLAARAAFLGGGSVVTPLQWARRVRDQSELAGHARRQNVGGAMMAARPRATREVWLVDDIVTTGATADECCRALAESGWTVLGVAVVASVEMQGPSPLAARDVLR